MNIKMYIGLTAKDGEYLSSVDVIKEVRKLKDNFTVINSIGYYNGHQESSLVFEFYNTIFIKNDVCLLAQKLHQECIGVYLLDSNKFELCFADDCDNTYAEFDNSLDDHYLFNN